MALAPSEDFSRSSEHSCIYYIAYVIFDTPLKKRAARSLAVPLAGSSQVDA